jgi:hypothetical protein
MRFVEIRRLESAKMLQVRTGTQLPIRTVYPMRPAMAFLLA